jgi:1-phosphofructokinase
MHTQLALPGPTLLPSDLQELHELLSRRVRAGAWLVLAGSIPSPGNPSTYGDLITMATEHGAFTALDADGPIVEGVLNAGVVPTVLKVNDHELSRLLHRPIENEDDALTGAREVHRRGVPNVVVTLGSEGAIAVTLDGEYRVRPPHIEVVSAVGAGDAFTSGLMCGLVRERDWVRALELGVAAGSAACLSPGTQLCAAVDVSRLRPLAQAEPIRVPAAAV